MNVRSTLLVIISILIIFLSGCSGIESRSQEESLTIATWNIRGYPESQQADRDWFHDQLIKMNPDIICIQEIANQGKADTFLANEDHFASVAFLDSSDGQDNAIFTTERIEIKDISDSTGFQHPAQAAHVAYNGFDAVISTRNCCIHCLHSYMAAFLPSSYLTIAMKGHIDTQTFPS